MKLIFLGPPGAGKGTQSEILSKKLNIPTISTGNILRAAVKEGTEIGLQAKSYMDAGQLVPDEVIIGIVADRLQQPDCAKGYILDGVPRTLAQAQALEDSGVHFDAVLSMAVSTEEVINRLSGRRSCTTCGATYHVTNNPPKTQDVCDYCGSALVQREDDKPETVRNRLDVYAQKTAPLEQFYAQRGNLKVVVNQPSIEATTAEVLNALEI